MGFATGNYLMIKNNVIRFAAFTLGLAGIVAASGPTARAEVFNYTSTVTPRTTAPRPPARAAAAPRPSPSPGGCDPGGYPLTFIANNEAGIDASQPLGADINFGNIDFNPNAAATTCQPYSVDVQLPRGARGRRHARDSGRELHGDRVGLRHRQPSGDQQRLHEPCCRSDLVHHRRQHVRRSPSRAPRAPVRPVSTLGALQGNFALRSVPEPGSVALLGHGPGRRLRHLPPSRSQSLKIPTLHSVAPRSRPAASGHRVGSPRDQLGLTSGPSGALRLSFVSSALSPKGTQMTKSTAFRLAAWTLGLAGIVGTTGPHGPCRVLQLHVDGDVTTNGSAPAGTGGGPAALATIPAGTINYIANSEAGRSTPRSPAVPTSISARSTSTRASTSTSTAPFSVRFNYRVVLNDIPSGNTQVLNFTGTESGFARGNTRFINSNFTSLAVAPATFNAERP